jgi:nucleoside-diphosphate-sugar epimerase
MRTLDDLQPFERPEFIPEFANYGIFRDRPLGLTGHRGLLGSLICRRLRAHGIEPHCFPGDINDAAALQRWFSERRLGYFLHLAAVVPVDRVDQDPLLAFHTNVIGAYNVCRGLLLAQRDCWFFQASTSHVYNPTVGRARLAEGAVTRPQSFYGTTKLAAEQILEPLLKIHAAPFCIGRIFSYWHPAQAGPYLVPALMRRISALPSGSTIEIRNAGAVRDIQSAETIVDCILHLALAGASGTVNIGTGIGRTVAEIAVALANAIGKRLAVHAADETSPNALVADISRLECLLRSASGAARA